MGCGVFRNGRYQPITPFKGSWTESIETPYQRHMTQARKERPAVPCNANHVVIGGGCFNCGWNGK